MAPSGSFADAAAMHALGLAGEPLAMQHRVHSGGGRALFLVGKQRGEMLGVLAPAFEARPVAGGERRHLVEEEQLAIALAPDLAMAVVEVELAADPLLRHPAPAAQFAPCVMQPPAAIAHEQPARRARKQMAERIDAVLQWHGRHQTKWPG